MHAPHGKAVVLALKVKAIWGLITRGSVQTNGWWVQAIVVLQVWLQEFAWTESEKPGKLAKRNASGPPGIDDSDISREPMFCVETMMTSLYWSLLIYDFNEVDDSKLTLEEGCTLFTPALEHYELFWEKSLDTKMVLAWSRQKIVMSFRGTASLANVVADLQVHCLCL